MQGCPVLKGFNFFIFPSDGISNSMLGYFLTQGETMGCIGNGKLII